MAILSVQSPGLAGTALTFSAAAGGGDSFANTGKQFLVVKNGNASTYTLTFTSTATCNFGVTSGHNKTVDCTGNAGTPVITVIGPFQSAKYNDTNGRVQVGYSGTTDLTVAALQLE